MKGWLASVCLALTALAAGCNESAQPTQARSYGRPAPPPRVVVSRDNGSLPRHCGVVRTASRVTAFLDAVNRGDVPLLERLIADRDHFQWYSLMRHLADRHAAGERMRLLELQITRIPPRGWFPSIAYDVTGVDFLVRVDAPDLASFPGHNRLAGGKGGFGCSDGRLLAWTMSLDTAGGRDLRASRMCRKASQRKGRWESATRRVVACTGY